MEKLLSVEELAERWGIPKTTFYRWRYVGYGPPGIAVGRHVRYRPADVERWLDEAQAAGDSAKGATVITGGHDGGNREREPLVGVRARSQLRGSNKRPNHE